jgi:hypothetical protein
MAGDHSGYRNPAVLPKCLFGRASPCDHENGDHHFPKPEPTVLCQNLGLCNDDLGVSNFCLGRSCLSHQLWHGPFLGCQRPIQTVVSVRLTATVTLTETCLSRRRRHCPAHVEHLHYQLPCWPGLCLSQDNSCKSHHDSQGPVLRCQRPAQTDVCVCVGRT